MSFDEEHLDEHYECQREVAERDARIRELEAALRTRTDILMTELSMDSPALRKNTIETLALLVERYPNLTIGQIVNSAVGPLDLYYTSDVDLARAFNQLFVSYTQFEAAGIKP
jgi:hypothetical protein